MNKKILLNLTFFTMLTCSNIAASTVTEIIDFINSKEYKNLTQEEKDTKLTTFIEKCDSSDINTQDKCGDTLLHKIAEAGNAKIMELLLNKGADVHLKGEINDTPLHRAATPECVKLLINRGANIHARTRGGYTPLNCQEILKQPKSVKLLIQLGANVNTKTEFGDTPLHNATSPKVAKILIKNGADVHARTWGRSNLAGQTPLHRAVWHYDETTAQRAKSKKFIKVLLNNGALDDINVQDKYGRTPLHFASHKNARILINHGADINICENEYGTPLHEAVKFKRYKKARILLECGANKYAICRHKESKIGSITPLRLAKTQRKNEEGYIRTNKKTRELFRTKQKAAQQEKAP